MGTKIERQGTPRDINETLSPAETLLIWRRRMGFTQMEAAGYFNVSYFVFKLAEYGVAKNFPYKKVKFKLRDHEKCLIIRKRLGKTQEQVADESGISREWLAQQERGTADCSKLLWWLEQHDSAKN